MADDRSPAATRRADDAYPKEVVVAGGLMTALWGRPGEPAQLRVEPVMLRGQATNELYVWPSFMKSRYRITVTLDPEPDSEPPEVRRDVQAERGYTPADWPPADARREDG
jgi:hypothetical protein